MYMSPISRNSNVSLLNIIILYTQQNYKETLNWVSFYINLCKILVIAYFIFYNVLSYHIYISIYMSIILSYLYKYI